MKNQSNDVDKQIQKQIENALGKQTILELRQDSNFIRKKYDDIFFDRKKMTEMLRILKLANLDEYTQKRQTNLLAFSNIIKGAGFILTVWKTRQIFNKILFGLVFLSFSNFFVDHWMIRKAVRNICLQTNFTPVEQQYRNLYEFYFPTDSKASEIQKLSASYFEYRAKHPLPSN